MKTAVSFFLNEFLCSRSYASLKFHEFSVREFIVDVNLTWRMFLESNFLNFCKSRFVASKKLISLKLRSREGFFSPSPSS